METYSIQREPLNVRANVTQANVMETYAIRREPLNFHLKGKESKRDGNVDICFVEFWFIILLFITFVSETPDNV